VNEFAMRRIADHALWIGHRADAQNPDRIYETGILAVVDLALDEPAISLPRDLIYCRFPLIDGQGNPPELLRVVIEAVAGFVRQNNPSGASKRYNQSKGCSSRNRGGRVRETNGMTTRAGMRSEPGQSERPQSILKRVGAIAVD
jgi:hypothetical protein